MQERSQLYIDGEWVKPDGAATIDVTNATTEEVMGSVPASTPVDVDKAVAAAKAAFGPWSATSPVDRAKFVQALSDGIGARNQEIAETITGEVGMPILMSQLIQAGLPQVGS